MDAVHALWTFPAIILAAMLIAWGAECGQFFVSQAMALAVLAWLQTLPEFAVEAMIAWEAGKDPSMAHLITANYTGSLRLFIGLGWPMVFFVQAFLGSKKYQRKRWDAIQLDDEHAIGVISLVPPLIYFVYIWWKGTLDWFDGLVLILLYGIYLFILTKLPSQDQEKVDEIGRFPKKVMRLKGKIRGLAIVGLFLLGGVVLLFTVESFLHSMLSLALLAGVSQFVFVQWVAPFLSEFPEKVSAFYWARSVTRAPMGLANFVSSSVNQWTLLVGMVPFVYAASVGGFQPIPFDEHQRLEILLTIAQSFLGFLFLASMDFKAGEAAGLFFLWFVQFIRPGIREEITVVYFLWIAWELIKLMPQKERLPALAISKRLVKKYLLLKSPPP